ncbi:MAG: hypothetical protein ACM3WU_09300 [Bacillota bacterium]
MAPSSEFSSQFLAFQIVVTIWAFARQAARLRGFPRLVKRMKGQTPEELRLGPENLADGDAVFAGCGVLNEAWMDYRRVVQASTQTLPEAASVFSYQRLITDYTGRQTAALLPGVFTGLGILGTFLGLVWGLGGMSVADATAIRGSIEILIDGMSTAFNTSILGLVASLAWSVHDRIHLKRAERALTDLHSMLAGMIPAKSEWDLLDIIADSQSEALATFKSFVSDTLIPEMISGIKGVMDQTLAPHLERTTEVFERFSDATSDRQVEGIDRMVTRFMEQLNGTYSGELNALTDIMKQMTQWQKTVQKEMQDLGVALSTAAKQEQEAVRASGKLLERIEVQVSGFEAAQEALVQLQEGIQADVAALHSLSETLTELNESAGVNLEQYMAASKQDQSMREKDIKILEGQIESMRTFWSQATQQLDQTRSALVSGTQAFNQQLVGSLKHTFEQYDSSLADATSRLRVVVSGMSEAVEDLPDEMDKIVQRLGELKEVVNAACSRISQVAATLAADGRLAEANRS